MFASPGAVAISFGPVVIRWYGLLIATAVLLGTTLAHREAIRRGQDADRLLNVVVLAVLAALIGARLYYVAFNWHSYYAAHPAKILAVWEGGLAIHGGLLAGGLATVLYCWHAGLSVPVTTDVFAAPRPRGPAHGRGGHILKPEGIGATRRSCTNPSGTCWCS
jgi:phosphatidylglycerol:prolipoprotein diacylglycerol transferase